MSETPPSPENVTADVLRERERQYQEWVARFEQRRRELQLERLHPEEARYRLLAEIGEFRYEYRATLDNA